MLYVSKNRVIIMSIGSQMCVYTNNILNLENIRIMINLFCQPLVLLSPLPLRPQNFMFWLSHQLEF